MEQTGEISSNEVNEIEEENEVDRELSTLRNRIIQYEQQKNYLVQQNSQLNMSNIELQNNLKDSLSREEEKGKILFYCNGRLQLLEDDIIKKDEARRLMFRWF